MMGLLEASPLLCCVLKLLLKCGASQTGEARMLHHLHVRLAHDLVELYGDWSSKTQQVIVRTHLPPSSVSVYSTYPMHLQHRCSGASGEDTAAPRESSRKPLRMPAHAQTRASSS